MVNTNAWLRCEVKGLKVTVRGVDRTVELPRVGSPLREIDGAYYLEVRCHWVSDERRLPIVQLPNNRLLEVRKEALMWMPKAA